MEQAHFHFVYRVYRQTRLAPLNQERTIEPKRVKKIHKKNRLQNSRDQENKYKKDLPDE